MPVHRPRLHLVAPDGPPQDILSCLEAAAAAGDIASLFVPPSPLETVTPRAQALGVAVMSSEAGAVLRASADGVEVASIPDYEAARKSLPPGGIVGGRAGISRHLAMELAEAGADYIAFAQGGREELIGWWSPIFQVPCIACDPVEVDALDILLPHEPDFIRPSDDMWSSPERARDICAKMMAVISR